MNKYLFMHKFKLRLTNNYVLQTYIVCVCVVWIENAMDKQNEMKSV